MISIVGELRRRGIGFKSLHEALQARQEVGHVA
jgi:hypothetical protein